MNAPSGLDGPATLNLGFRFASPRAMELHPIRCVPKLASKSLFDLVNSLSTSGTTFQKVLCPQDNLRRESDLKCRPDGTDESLRGREIYLYAVPTHNSQMNPRKL